MEVKEKTGITLTCTKCQQQFNDNDKFNEHACIEKTENNILPHDEDDDDALDKSTHQCRICNMIFDSENSLLIHNKMAHLNSTITAPDLINNENVLNVGKQTIRVVDVDFLKGTQSDESFRCEICSVQSKSAKEYALHKKSAICSGYFCDICGKNFLQQRNVDTHKRKMHKSAVPPNLPSLCCNICNETFPSLEDYTLHSMSHANDILLCGDCEFQCHSIEEMKVHKLLHSQYKYKCIQCDNFNTDDSDDFQNHIRLHQEIKTEENSFVDGNQNPLEVSNEVIYLRDVILDECDVKTIIKKEIPDLESNDNDSRCHNTLRMQECFVVLEQLPDSIVTEVQPTKIIKKRGRPKKKNVSSPETEAPNNQNIIDELLPRRLPRKRNASSLQIPKIEVESDDENIKENIIKIKKKKSGLILEDGEYSEKKRGRKKYFCCNVCEFGSYDSSTFEKHVLTHPNYEPLHCAHCEFGTSRRELLIKHVYKHFNWTLFKCSICAKGITNLKSFRSHMVRHSGIKRHHCKLCNQSFFIRSDLVRHNKNHHTKNEIILCDRCPKSFKNPQQLKNHMISHPDSNTKIYKCTQCDFTSYLQHMLNRHIVRKHGTNKNAYICDHCGAPFALKCDILHHLYVRHSGYQAFICRSENCSFRTSTKRELKKHKVEVHNVSKREKGKPMECKFCRREFSRHFMNRHLLEAHSDVITKYECNECGSVFSKKFKLTAHLFDKHFESKKIYPCPICGKTFNRPQHLSSHKQGHKASQEVPCNMCPKVLTSYSGFKAHMKTHLKKYFKYSCNFCNFKCRLPHELTMHNRFHKNETIFQCPKCPYNFDSLRNLKCHDRVVHQAGKHICDQCDYSTHKPADLKMHKKRRHNTGDYNYECFICGMKYAAEPLLNRHKYLSHKHLLPFRCEECDFKCAGMQELKKHINLNHSFNLNYVCNECSMRFKSKKLLLMHTNILHRNVQKYKCTLCNFACGSRNGLDIHNKRIHNKESNKELLVDATFVGSNLSHSFDETSLNVAVFDCDKCHYVSHSVTEFNDHKSVHTLNGHLNLKQDNHNEYETSNQLQAPQNLEVDPCNNVYSCNQCNFTCNALHSMELHKNDHRDEKSLVLQDFENSIPHGFIRQQGEHFGKKIHNTITYDDSSDDDVALSNYNKIRSESKTEYEIEFEKPKSIDKYENDYNDIPTDDHSDDNYCNDEPTYNKVDDPEIFDIEDKIHKYCDKNSLRGKLIKEDSVDQGNENLHEQENDTMEYVIEIDPHNATNITMSQDFDWVNDVSAVFKCAECPKTFTKLIKLEKHTFLKHATSEWHTCSNKTCDFFTNNVKEYLNHVKKHKTKGTYKCAHCHFFSDNKKSFMVHKLVHVRPFLCEICSYCSTTKNSFMEHMNTHTKQDIFECDYCGKVYLRRKELVNHIRNTHVWDKVFPCHLCDYTARTNHSLCHHRERHHTSTNNFHCKFCKLKFPSKRILKIHMRRLHFVTTAYKQQTLCGSCGKSFKTNGGLKTHIKLCHANEDGKFNCEICNKQYSTINSLKAHRVKHTNEYIYCAHCSYKCYNKHRLRSHLQKVHTLSFSCSVCSKQFRTQYKLQLHAKLHESKRNHFFECSICERSFSTYQIMKQHERRYCQQKQRLHCSHCDYKSRKLSDLKAHIDRSHKKEKNFICIVCSQPFASQVLLNIHKRTRHKHLNPFHCDQCTFKFKTIGDLKLHINVAHTSDKDKPYQCLHCPYKFAQKRHVSAHMTVVHKNEQKFACEFCNFACNSEIGIRLHGKRLHSAVM